MSERKVLNKYYPPDFDHTKIPRLKGPKNRTFTIRIMAPFNMRCGTCGEYIYKGKKFNSRKETVEDEKYLGLHIFRFYIRCPRCVAEISFKTDPENTDYSLEAGATRNFEAARTAEELDRKEQQRVEDEEANNPMKVLENRTKQSRTEMERIEQLEELRELNSRHAKVDHEHMINVHQAYDEMLQQLQEEEDENLVKSIFGEASDDGYVKRLHDSDEEEEARPVKMPRGNKATDILASDTKKRKIQPESWTKSVGCLSVKAGLKGLVVKKKVAAEGPIKPNTNAQHEPPPSEALGVVPALTTSGTGLGLLGSYSDSESDSN